MFPRRGLSRQFIGMDGLYPVRSEKRWRVPGAKRAFDYQVRTRPTSTWTKSVRG